MGMNKNNQRYPLSPEDTETITLGCRHSAPRICRNADTPGKCAFVRADRRCHMPPASWKKLFAELRAEVGIASNITSANDTSEPESRQ